MRPRGKDALLLAGGQREGWEQRQAVFHKTTGLCYNMIHRYDGGDLHGRGSDAQGDPPGIGHHIG